MKINILILTLIGLFTSSFFISCYKHIDKEKSTRHYQKDGKVYYRQPSFEGMPGSRIPMNADLESFQILKGGYSKDKDKAFFMHKEIKSVDVASFYIDKAIPKDKDHIYMGNNRGAGFYPINISGVDVKSFEFIFFADSLRPKWAKDRGYYSAYVGVQPHFSKDVNSYYFRFKKLNVDYNSFKQIGRHIYSDKDSLYYTFLGYDFRTITENNESKVINDYYTLSGDSIFFLNYNRKALDQAVKVRRAYLGSDKELTILNDYVVKSKTKVFYFGMPFANKSVDTKSFQYIGYNYRNQEKVFNGIYKDTNHIYLNQKIIQGADVKSYEVLDQWYGRDSAHVFYMGKILEGVNPTGFHQPKRTRFIWKDDKGDVYGPEGTKLKPNVK